MKKRIFDLLLCIPLLLLSLPVLLAAGVAVRLSSDGPILFRQRRMGRFGKPFEILKFRTMQQGGSSNGDITVGRDPRVTAVGAALRKWKIDELPQLINVLRGEMSLVGPRPDLPHYVAFYPEELRRIVLSVRPGITDRASIKYRNENELLAAQADPERYYREEIMPDKLKIAAEYARHPALSEDIRIILATLGAIVGNR
jgi:lipopolysaccharide/colanic/teichoic acid biosynthesis glycosyltransferase